MNLRVFYHDKCFDGACSASLFSRFHRECIGTAATYDYQGLVHRAGALYDDAWFDVPGEIAIVDFKYSASPRITWWFDHHLSAFLNAADEANYRNREAAQANEPPIAGRHFFNPDYTSCCSWIAHIAATKFGMNIDPLQELIHWADIVDGAKYPSAEAAVGMAEPAMRLTMVIESAPDSALVQRIIPLLTEQPLAATVAEPFIAERLTPLLDRHHRDVTLIRERADCRDGVITFDITDHPTEGYNKFIPYFIAPEGNYNVGLSKSSFRNKVSVGTNPWTTRPVSQLMNLSAICERYGGGGHARVGAISFPVDREAEARAAAAEIAAELRAHEKTVSRE